MVAEWLFVLSLLMVSVGRLEAVASCAPSCAGASAETDLVPVPWDCTLYSMCGELHGDGVLWPSDPMSCPDGEFFDSDITPTGCAAIVAGSCNNTCSPCELYWRAQGDKVPDPYDCDTYHVSVAGNQFVEFTCSKDFPDQPFYDYRTGDCSSDERVCYNYCDTCQTYCTTKDTKIADPLDCTGFYYCDPPLMTRFQCPINENFDSDLGICSDQADCITC